MHTETISVLAGGGVSALVTFMSIEVAKRIPKFPLEPGQTMRLRAAAAGLSSLIAVAMVWSDPSAPPSALAEAVEAFAIALVSFVGSHGAYKAFKAVSDGMDGGAPAV